MANILVVNAEGSQVRVGLLEDGVLTDFHLERARERHITGSIYRGRVDRVLPGMEAAFLDLGPGVERKAYLHVSEIVGNGDPNQVMAGFDSGSNDDSSSKSKKGKSKKSASKKSSKKDRGSGQSIDKLLKKGQHVLVQVVKEPLGEKGARVSGYLSLPGRHCVFMPAVDKVGVSHKIDSARERKRLRDIVEDARPKGAGFIIRTAAEGADEQEVRDDVSFLLTMWEQVRQKEKSTKAAGLLFADLDLVLRCIRDLLRPDIDKIVIDDEEQYTRARKFAAAFMPHYEERIERYKGRQTLFDAYGIEQELRQALNRHVPLKSGGSLVIDQGEALTAIDVNTGSFVGRTDLEDTITRNNLEASVEIARQLRIRNIGGIIVLDFVDMEKAANRKKVFEAFTAELAKDRARSNVTKISQLGLLEMTRKRTRESLRQLLTESCPCCEGRAVVKSPTTIAYEVLREVRRVGSTVEQPYIEVEASPGVVEILETHERDYIDFLEKKFQKMVQVHESIELAPETFKVAGEDVQRVADEKTRRRGGGGNARGGKRRSRGGRGRSKGKTAES